MAYMILEQIKIRLDQYHVETISNPDGSTSEKVVFDDLQLNPKLEVLINQNRELILCRVNPPEYYTEEQKEEILEKYKGAVIDMTLYDVAKEGGDFQKSHSELGISRTWISKDEIMDYYNIRIFSKILSV